jgi:catechol 2,3-dioxygenase-like lactoylglutathione lyase family enzyme
MPISFLDHVNLRTSHLKEMVRWYEDALGFKLGDRPPFKFGGAWMYLNDWPVVHLVETEAQPNVNEPQIEHFAFRAKGLAEFAENLRNRGIEHRMVPVPGNNNAQIFTWDPDGNRIEIQFEAAEAATVDKTMFSKREQDGSSVMRPTGDQPAAR